MEEKKTGYNFPPLHPNDRCTVSPIVDGAVKMELLPRTARDPKTGEKVKCPPGTTWREWKKQIDEICFEHEKSASREKEYSVNWNAVKGEEYKKKFKEVCDDENVSKTLHSKSLDILKHRQGTDYEDMYLINRFTGKTVASQTKVEYTKGIPEELKHKCVWYNDEIMRVLSKSPGDTFITIHNHAENKPPSGGDFDGAFKNGYYAGLNICHDGTVYYYKVGVKRFSGNLYDATVAKYINMGYTEQEAYESALNQFARDYGITWRKL